MIIELTRAQWESLVPIVKMGAKAEMALGLPIDLDNGDQHIEITANGVQIVLLDEE